MNDSQRTKREAKIKEEEEDDDDDEEEEEEEEDVEKDASDINIVATDDSDDDNQSDGKNTSEDIGIRRRTRCERKAREFFKPELKPTESQMEGVKSTTSRGEKGSKPMVITPDVFEVERIVDIRGPKRNGVYSTRNLQCKVHWLGFSEEDETWEPYSHVQVGTHIDIYMWV